MGLGCPQPRRAQRPDREGLGCCSLAEGQRGSAGCGGRGDSDTGADGARQGQNSPLMQVEKRGGTSPPAGAGTGTAAVSRGTPGIPRLSLHNKHERRQDARGRGSACPPGALAGPRCSQTAPAGAVSLVPRLCRSSPGSAAVGLGCSREEILGQLSQEPVQVICTETEKRRSFTCSQKSNQLHIPGTRWDKTLWRDREGDAPPRPGTRFPQDTAGPTHPCRSRQLPLPHLAWARGSAGAGRSPQEPAPCCPSLTDPRPQGQGHPQGAVQGGPGAAQPGHGPAKPSRDGLEAHRKIYLSLPSLPIPPQLLLGVPTAPIPSSAPGGSLSLQASSTASRSPPAVLAAAAGSRSRAPAGRS